MIQVSCLGMLAKGVVLTVIFGEDLDGAKPKRIP
jgi:hypothetical protein